MSAILQSKSSNVNKFKLLLVGDSGVGKTTFITRHKTAEFTREYNPTMGVEVNPLNFHTTVGQVSFQISVSSRATD